MRSLAWLLLVGAASAGWACGTTSGSEDGDCTVGSLGCTCTAGGGCDPGLGCVVDMCVLLGATGGGPGDGADDGADDGSMTSAQGTSTTRGPSVDGTTGGAGVTTDDPSTTGSADTLGETTDGGAVFDLGVFPDTRQQTMGCQAIDMLFVLDGSASMAEERAALSAAGAFGQIIMTLESLNEGSIDYRIGVTDDDDHGFLVPGGWFGADPWFDSEAMTPMEVAAAFDGAAGQVGALGGAPTGCEHVLTSGTALLDGDVSGFVRDDALLVLVLLTDVDDYGAYDQAAGNSCGIGCEVGGAPVQTFVDTLVALKNDDPAGVAAIVVSGDPSVDGGTNFCDQPASCGCVEVFPDFFDCDVFHGTRLWDFASLLQGQNGHTADLCAGPAAVPTAVETALTDSIEIACEAFEPEG